MKETTDEIVALQQLLDRSHGGATAHLKEIIAGEHRLDAAAIVDLMTGMKVLSLATVTAAGEPRISAVDGHFLHGSWTFGTDGRAAKARHIETRPAVSAAYIDGERYGVFTHGTAHLMLPDDPRYVETVDHWTAHYGSDPHNWADDIRLYRLDATWMVGYAGTP